MSFLPTVAASVPTHRGCPPGAKPAEHSPQWLWGPRYSLGAACHSIQLSSYKHHSLAPHRTAPHRTAPHASPLRACRQHHELLPREPLHAPAPSPEPRPRARAQDTARSSRPRSPASRRHAALPRNCSPPPPSTSCPGPSNRLRRHVAKGGLGAARGLWGGRCRIPLGCRRRHQTFLLLSSFLFVSYFSQMEMPGEGPLGRE